MRVPRTLLVPVDLTPAAAEVVQCARALAAGLGAAIELLHVLPSRYSGADAEATAAFERARAGAALRDLLARDAGDGVPATGRLDRGEPVERILAVSGGGFDLIVMGASGRGSWSQLVRGGIAEAVLRRARCPVVLVRPKRVHAHAGELGIALG